MKNNAKIAKHFRYLSRTALIIITTTCFVFALLSGRESFGGGLKGILLNIPNTFPWLLLFAIVYIGWKWELIGGSIITSIGLFSIFFFHTYKSPITMLGISIPLITIGLFLIASWYLTRHLQK